MRGSIYPADTFQALIAPDMVAASYAGDLYVAIKTSVAFKRKRPLRVFIEYVLTFAELYRRFEEMSGRRIRRNIPIDHARAEVLRAARSCMSAVACRMEPFWASAREAGELWARRKRPKHKKEAP